MDKFLDLIADGTLLTLLTTVLTSTAGILGTIYAIKKLNTTHNDNLTSQITEIALNSKRIELNQVIDHDYGVEVVSLVYSQYKMLGGNSYMTEKVKKYFEDKTEEWEH